MFDKFGDTNSTRVPRSSVFEGSLARDLDWKTFVPKVYLYRHTMLLFWPMFIFRGRRETFDSFLSPERRSGWQDRTLFHPCGRSGTCCTLLKRWQAWVDMKSAFRSSFLRQAQDDVWKGLKVSLCETVVVFELVHDDYAWQAQFFGCLRIMFRGRRSASETATNKCLIPTFSHLQ